MRTWITLCLVGLAGCFPVAQMAAADLAGRAEQNMVEAQSSFAGQTLIVTGTIGETTLAPRERVEAAGSTTAFKAQEQLPLVVLQPGSVWCYFEPGDIRDVATLRKGDEVAFKCEVSYFKKVQQTAVSVLARCRNAK